VTVFLDTVGLLAVWDSTDQWHQAAQARFAQLQTAREELVCTTFILTECGNASARRPYRDAVCRLRERLESSNRLVVPTEDDWRMAWQAYQVGQAESAGIVDHISFVVMRRLGITKAFTNDRHFRAAGFEILF
jgi:predicted nucleic acid-binding protein